jgi:hypothetical protein
MSTSSNEKSNGKPHMDPADRMKMLERRAKVVRSRLVRAIDSLDSRRHQIETIGATAKRVAMPMALSAVGILALFGASAVAFGIAIKRKRQRRFSYRLVQSIRELDLVQRPSFLRRMLEKGAMSLVTLALTEAVKRASKNVLDGRLLDGRLATHDALEDIRENRKSSVLMLKEAKP